MLLESLLRFADETLADGERSSSIYACVVQGGASMAALTFMLRTPGPWAEGMRRIASATGVDFDHPAYVRGDHILGLCHVAGANGLLPDLRHRAVDTLVSCFRDNTGYAEARHLLPKKDWEWLADAVREGWAVLPARLLVADETIPLKTRTRVGLALTEHEAPAGFVPDGLAKLVSHPKAASGDRFAIAAAVARRDPRAGVELLCSVASDPVVQTGHRMQAIRLLEEFEPVRAEAMRAHQTRLPSRRGALDSRREKVDLTTREEAARHERESPEAVAGRLDAEIEELLGELRIDSDLGDGLDSHIAEANREGVAQDVADIVRGIRSEGIDSSLRLLELLTRIKHGNESGTTSDGPASGAPESDVVPRLTQDDLEAYAREQTEWSWSTWRKSIEKHGWDDDRIGEVQCQVDETAQHVSGMVVQETDDHLRTLQKCLTWEIWPAFTNAVEERDYIAARRHLATARLLAEEVERAETLWRHAAETSYSFDPLSMSWSREFWLVLEEWKHHFAGR
ncbi:hypothetical protein [Umezawaea sp. Da 62-37]|uniref:hypothetical protein n=1 Tax=Umezawaea sp. Da 62-37 TaxID=3075927 RepID=UPI0028F6C91E|nr:hypothetical protein [Umezawaea sp. Da 62-37]WNV82616.1 hypothetical protein RM788_31010 [Umezawaea sp. Da 62-37]